MSVVLERQYQHALLFSLAITNVLSLSYMMTVRFAWDKTAIFYGCLIGGIPARMAVGLCMSYFAMLLTDIHQGMFVFSMMFWWIGFTALEFGMALEYWHKVKWKNVNVNKYV
ncbi:hypothetical protein C4577_07375 [Candidatus Parcubacteria bacterium]|nr:MAG: hypothetical protein C4577_07375 [Candidatus Parcubacteria bacterium]